MLLWGRNKRRWIPESYNFDIIMALRNCQTVPMRQQIESKQNWDKKTRTFGMLSCARAEIQALRRDEDTIPTL